MPALPFKRQFIPLIKAGLEIRALGREPYPAEACKLQTIRNRVKRPFKAGDTLYLGVGMRTSSYERIGTAVCREVLQIQIFPRSREVLLENHEARMLLQLGEEEITELAAADGFDSAASFFDFFASQYETNAFSGQLIKW